MRTPAIVKRLTSQVQASTGWSRPAAQAVAVRTLTKTGSLNADGSLTAKGRTRTAMGASGRAIDRAASRSGKPKSAYQYNARTNRATLK